jgi:hypothetical protein
VRIGWPEDFILIRASAKFRHQYSCAVESCDPPVRPFPQTWNLDILSHGRSQLLVLAIEEYSLFSLLVPTSRARNFGYFMAAFRERLLQLFEYVGIRSADQPDLYQVTLVGRTDRRIIGSQNDLLFMARHYLNDADKPASSATLRSIEEWVNETPMSYLEIGSPIDVFKQKTKQLVRI